jgi:predicted metalloprotease with PDZ domain
MTMKKHGLKNTMHFLQAIIFVSLTCSSVAFSQQTRVSMHFTVAMNNPADQAYQVTLQCDGIKKDWIDFKIPVWMPGYYQLLDYADNINTFTARDTNGQTIRWENAAANIWRVYSNNLRALTISYTVKATRNFVATNYLDAEHGFIAPTGLFMHVDGFIKQPVTVTIKPYAKWNKIATGLEPVTGKNYTYAAPDFDVLYDSPLLIGNLEELPSFSVKGVPHYFTGYKLGNFNKEKFMADLKRIVEAAVDIMGDIPFKHYTFIAIGPGNGGIEHLNSTAVSFSGEGLDGPRRNGMLSFLAHEYFHHYNAKRIRPIELGPFDYDRGSRTNMLWVAEGITAYYDELLLKRAGLISGEDLLKAYRSSILAYENKPGRLFQSVTQASYDTWSDGPFGRTGDDINKTISYYDKGPVLGMLLDFKIRHATNNKQSLDDVMRTLYKNIYQQKNRGYTEVEFRNICESVAGVSLADFFEYVYTVKEIDYVKYFAYAGLHIDTKTAALPGAWLGISVREKNDTLGISQVEWDSPAWHAGIRARQSLLTINGEPATAKEIERLQKERKPGEIVQLQVMQQGVTKNIALLLDTKYQKPFTVSRVETPTTLQAAILKDWLKAGTK